MGKISRADNFSGFDSGFVDSILHLMITDQKFMREQHENLNPDLFNDDMRVQLAKFALGFFDETGCVAKNLYVNYVLDKCNDARVTEARKKLLTDKASLLYTMSPGSVSYITTRLKEFFEFAKLKNARYLLDKAIDEGDLSGAKEIIKQAINTLRRNGHERPVDYFGTIEKRVMRRETVMAQQDGVHFLIPTLDNRGIFAHRGEIALVIAPSKRGKSVFLTHVGKCALYLGHNVLHVSLENPIGMVEDRYDSMLSGIEIEQLRIMADRLENKLKSVSGLAAGRLHILWRMARTYSPLDLKADVEALRNDGKNIDTVVIDYGELMRPVGKYSGESSMRASRDDVFMNLRGIATEMNFTCITAQQTPLKKRSKFRIYMEDGQESSMPAQHSSLILTLNQTSDEQAAGEMRLYVDGYWHGPSGAQIGDILLKQDLARMQFCLEEVPITSGVSHQKGVV